MLLEPPLSAPSVPAAAPNGVGKSCCFGRTGSTAALPGSPDAAAQAFKYGGGYVAALSNHMLLLLLLTL
jgi:hypothetical protein